MAAVRQLEPVQLRRLVRGELDWIVMKCLEKDRSRRYETANGLARDVGRFLADESVEAFPPSAGYRLGKFVRKNRGPVLAAAAIFLLLAGGILGTSWGLFRARRAWIAEAARTRGEREAKLQAQKRLEQIEKGSELLASVFKDLDPRSEEREGKSLRVILADRLSRAGEQIEGEVIGDPLVAAGLQLRLGLSLLRLGRVESAIPFLEKSRATRVIRLGADHLDTLTSMNGLAQSYQAAGQFDKALPLLEETLKLRRAKQGPDHPETLVTMNDLAMGYQATGRLNEALPLLEETLKRRKATLGERDPDTLSSMNNLAVYFANVGKLDQAGPLYEEALRLRRVELAPDHVDTLNTMDGLGTWYIETGKTDRGVTLLAETLKLRTAKLGPDHIDTLKNRHNLGFGYKRAGKLELALPFMEETVRLARTKLGPDHPFTLSTTAILGSTYQSAGKLDMALPLFQEAAAGVEKRGFRHEHSALILNALSITLEKLKRFEEAAAWRRKCLTVVKENSGTDSLDYARELAELGANLLAQKKWKESEALLRESLAFTEKKPAAAPAKFNTESLLGRALLGQKRFAEAEPLLIGGYEGLLTLGAKSPPKDRHRVAQAGEPIVLLYEAWGRPEKATEWRAKLPVPGETASEP